jgi:hypothetical protein
MILQHDFLPPTHTELVSLRARAARCDHLLEVLDCVNRYLTLTRPDDVTLYSLHASMIEIVTGAIAGGGAVSVPPTAKQK